MTATTIDPVRYEMFRHRLFNILEEGRMAMHMVSGSPVVAEGGECMASFYTADGTVILTAAGILLHTTGCHAAIKKAIEWYEESPGIYDGDQFFFNDPYIAATHVYDMLVVKPIFWEGRRIAWAGAMMHTSDTGGVLRGNATEVFHEGIRFQGLKIVERNRIRNDAFRAITEMCRDPAYVGLDLMSRVAANNVAAASYLALIEKYGVDFVEGASYKIIEDTEKQARARLRSLPDGTWRSRVYGQAYTRSGEARVYRVICTMTKTGDSIVFDYAGTSAQNEDTYNATFPCAESGLFAALAGFLFWDVPWNGGMIAPVELRAPLGSLLNCRFPAACGNGTGGAVALEAAAATDCIVRMLYAGGLDDDVNAAMRSYGYPERGRYGGHNQFGGVVQQQIYHFMAGGMGATPKRDGVHSGGHPINPQAKISDVEVIEMNYPLMFLSNNQLQDSGGWGRYAGGVGMQRIMTVYGSQDFTDNHGVQVGIPAGKGLFGGYPAIPQDFSIWRTEGELKNLLASGRYPARHDEVTSENATQVDPLQTWRRIPVHEWDLFVDRGVSNGGSGYGDPLDREPWRVAEDVRAGLVSATSARLAYGVVLDSDGVLDDDATARLRAALRQVRRAQASPVTPGSRVTHVPDDDFTPTLRCHEYLTLGQRADGSPVMRCRCGAALGDGRENYKRYCLRRVKDWHEAPLRATSDGRPTAVTLQEYFCPGCLTCLEVDVWYPELDDDTPLWDIELA